MTKHINPYQSTNTIVADSKSSSSAVRLAAVVLNLITIGVQGYFVFVLMPKYFRRYDEVGVELNFPTLVIYAIPHFAWVAILGLCVALVMFVECFLAKGRGKTTSQFAISFLLLGLVTCTFIALRLPLIRGTIYLP